MIAPRQVSVISVEWVHNSSSLYTVLILLQHVLRHHEGDPEGVAPLADLSERLTPPHPPLANRPLPETVTIDRLITQPISGTVYATVHRREWVRVKVANNCFAGENPVMHVEHPPHMLEKVDDTDFEWDSDESDELLDAAAVRVERLADRGWNRPPRGFICTVELPTRKRWLVYPEDYPEDIEEDEDKADDEADEGVIDLTEEEAAWILADNEDEGEVEDTMEAEEISINGLGEGSGLVDAVSPLAEEDEERLLEQTRAAQDELRHWDEMNAQDDEVDEQELLDALDAAEAAEAVDEVEMHGEGIFRRQHRGSAAR